MKSDEKIDMYCHIIPPKFKEGLFRKGRPCYYIENTRRLAVLSDLDIRFKGMDRHGGVRQLLALGAPPPEYVFSPRDAVELAQIANDEMAELVLKYPDRFVGAVAGLPMNDIDAAIREAERAIQELKFKGVQVFCNVNGKPLDRPEFLGLYEKMAQHDVPIWLHPLKEDNHPDYQDEKVSKYRLSGIFGYPYETTLAMSRLVFSGIMEKYPNLKVVVHHCGAMLPFFWGRLALVKGQTGEIMKLAKPPLEYFRSRFYGDTVLGGNTAALMCGYDFFGADNMVFGTDYPYPGGADHCDARVGEIIKSVEFMDITEEEKAKIFSKNARRILKMSEQ